MPATPGTAKGNSPAVQLTPARALATHRPATAPPAVRRRATPTAVPLRSRTPFGDRHPPAPGPAAPSTAPLAPRTSLSGTPANIPALPVTANAPSGAPRQIQRAPEAPALLKPSSATTTTAVSAVTAHRTTPAALPASAGDSSPPRTPDPPLPDTPSEPSPVSAGTSGGGFDPRSLTDFQLDELTHRLIGRITRLVRTELRLDRERIGKLRDPRR